MDIARLFEFQVSPLELILRGTLVYWFLLMVFRFVIPRAAGGIGLADVLVLVLIAGAAQNAMVGEAYSVSEGLLVVSTILGWNWLLDFLSFHSKLISRFVRSPPLTLIDRGVAQSKAMRAQMITLEELRSHLRLKGIEDIKDVKIAVLEDDEHISVIPLVRKR